MKALVILKEMRRFRGIDMSEDEFKNLCEAISELEALQSPKTCDGCKYFRKEYNSDAFKNDCQRPISKNCSRRFNDYYEPKESSNG